MRDNKGRTSGPIDFPGLAHALLSQADSLVERWLPNGVERNGRWYVGDFDGGQGESANVNLATGQWIDNGSAGDQGGDLISLYARIHGLTNGEAARELMDQLGMVPVQAPALPARAATDSDSRPAPPPDEAEPAAAEASAPKGKPQKWTPLAPVPPRCPRPQAFRFSFKDKKAGAWVELDAVRTWEYVFEGELYGYVARFARVSSSGELVKDTVPLTWCVNNEDGRGNARWHWKQWQAPRPLYVPGSVLSGDLSLPVVIVEGEKCAEAGHQLLGHEFDFVSWPGGCKTWQLARWAWLMGRTVYLWPDCDAKREPPPRNQSDSEAEQTVRPLLPEQKQPGMKAMVGIGSLLMAEYGCAVNLCPIPKPGDVSDGWDIADAIAQGWDAAQVRNFIRSAVAFVPPDESARAAAGNPGVSGAAAGPGSAGADDAHDWRRYLLLSDKNAVKAVRENIVLALDGWTSKQASGAPEVAGLIAFNEFTNNVTKRRDSPWNTAAGDWDEADELLMGEWLVREQFLPSMARATLEEAVLMVAKRHAYHPVRQEIEAYRGTWDKEKRLATWLVRAAISDDDPLTEADRQYLARVGTWMVMAICARVLTPEKRNGDLHVGPGVKFDYMPIFEGPQGWGKSTLAKILGGDYFADTGLVLGEKDSYQNLQGILVYEWGELDSLNRSEVTKVKQFVSSQKDRFRASFDRRPRDYPRQVVFIGTTNEDHYLTDPTGNRRFWPVRISKPIDQAWVRSMRQQLFAEALHYLDAGERFHPTPREQRELFDPQQQLRTIENSIETAMWSYLYDEDQKVPYGGLNGTLLPRVTLDDLLERIGYTIDKRTPQVKKQAGSAMKRMGWAIGPRANERPGRPRYYLRPKDKKPDASPSAAGGHINGSPQSQPTEGAADACPL